MSLTLSALVVDDSAAMRKQLAFALQRVMGIHATEATDGADAWRKLSTGVYDVVLTDINMPLMDGLKLISPIRQSGGAHQQVPIVVITTEGAVEDRRRAMDLGASAYLVKPVQSQQVVEALRSLFGQKAG